MPYQRLDLSSWTTILTANSPSGVFGHTIIHNVTDVVDRAIFTITHTNEADWVRAGWIAQVGVWNNDEYLITKDWINLNESKILYLEPLANQYLVFEPVGWLIDYGIKIETRDFVDT